MTVRDGVVEAAFDLDTGTSVALQVVPDYWTVEAMFDLLQRALDDHADIIDADFDADWGYPTNIFIDYSQATYDGEIVLSASNLQAL